jgi:hypothetical protein
VNDRVDHQARLLINTAYNLTRHKWPAEQRGTGKIAYLADFAPRSLVMILGKALCITSGLMTLGVRFPDNSWNLHNASL